MWFSIGSGGGENRESQNLSLGWPSVGRAKVMVFHRFSVGVGGPQYVEQRMTHRFDQFAIGPDRHHALLHGCHH